MNSYAKKILKIIIPVIVILTVVLYASLYWWFHNSIDNVLTSKQQNWLLTEIDNSTVLPDKIYNTMRKYFPDFYASNTWNYKIKKVLGIKTSYCQCNELYLPFLIKKQTEKKNKWDVFQQDDLIIKLFIEKKFSQKECFTFNMNISDFGLNSHGIFEAAKTYFNKELKNLTEEEIIGLFFIRKAPTHYNPISNKKNYEKAVNEIMKTK